jgi:hypothetical protein
LSNHAQAHKNDTPSLCHDIHTIKLSSKAIKPKSGTMDFPKTKDNLVKMQDGIMPKKTNKGKNSNFLLNP